MKNLCGRRKKIYSEGRYGRKGRMRKEKNIKETPEALKDILDDELSGRFESLENNNNNKKQREYRKPFIRKIIFFRIKRNVW